MLSKREIDRRIRFRHNHSRVIMSHLHNLLPNYFRVRKWIQQYFRVRKWIHPAFSSAFETEIAGVCAAGQSLYPIVPGGGGATPAMATASPKRTEPPATATPSRLFSSDDNMRSYRENCKNKTCY